MLKHVRRVMVLVLVLVISFVLTACGTESAVDIIKKTAVKLDSITSMEATMHMQAGFKMQLAGQTQNLNTSAVANITSFKDPIQMKMDMHMKMDAAGQEQSIDMETYAVQEDSTLMMYTKTFGIWQKQAVTTGKQLEMLQQYNAHENLNIYMENVDSFQEVSTEQLNGVEVYRLDGTLSGKSLKKAIEASGAMEQLGQITGGGEDLYTAMFDNLRDMPITIWANKKDLMPMRYEIDMTQTMQAMLGNLIAAQEEMTGKSASEAFEMNCTVFRISTDMFNFNNAAQITVPQEALDSTK